MTRDRLIADLCSYEAQEARYSRSRPHCDCCGEPMGESLWDFSGDWICAGCVSDAMEWADHYDHPVCCDCGEEIDLEDDMATVWNIGGKLYCGTCVAGKERFTDGYI